MSIQKNIIDEIKCCLDQDGHYVQEPILLTCGGNACKRCRNVSQSVKYVKCYSCKQQHNKSDYKDATINKMMETFINFHLSDLDQELNANLLSLKDSLKGL